MTIDPVIPHLKLLQTYPSRHLLSNKFYPGNEENSGVIKGSRKQIAKVISKFEHRKSNACSQSDKNSVLPIATEQFNMTSSIETKM